MADIKLYYFDIRGRAEVSRMILMLSGCEFEDVRWPREDWPKYKPDAPFGQSPYLEYQGKKYGQSHAIAAFLANEFDLYGKNNLERLRIDEVIALVDDTTNAFVMFHTEQDELKKKELGAKFMTEDVPRICNFLDKLLQENGSCGYYVGHNLTLADLYVYDLLDNLTQHTGYNVWNDFSALRTLRDKLEQDPRMSAYLDKRKKSSMGV